jgi:flagellar biosynthesis anti-sigma factor FlgM
MRIDSFNSTADQVSNELSSQQVGAQNVGQANQAEGEDRATLTSDSTSVGSLVSAALSSDPVRQNLVDSLRQAVNSGQYNLDPGQIAGSILNEQA